MCEFDPFYVCVYTRGLGTPTSQHNVFDSEKLSQIFLLVLLNLGALDLESDALPIEPPCHPNLTSGVSPLWNPLDTNSFKTK